MESPADLRERGKEALAQIFSCLPDSELEKFVNQLEEARFDPDTDNGNAPVIMAIGRFKWAADEAWRMVLEKEIGAERLREIVGEGGEQ